MRLILILCLLAWPTSAFAGAWVMQQGSGKMSLSQFSYRHDMRLLSSAAEDRLRDDYAGLLIEYGLTEKLTVTAKAAESRFRAASNRSETQEARFGLMLNAPYLETGLLPPYLFQLARTVLPGLRLHRQKRASLHLGHMQRGIDGGAPKSGRFMTVALADKLMSGPWHLMQEVEYGEVQRGTTQEHDAMYRLSLGRGAWQISSQATRFENDKSHFVALSHSYRLRWKPPQGRIELVLSRGHRRIGQGLFRDTRIFRGRQWALEVQLKF